MNFQAAAVIFFATLVTARTAVLKESPDDDSSETVYDQRQNGTENYRINVDGVMLAIAPAEALLAAVSAADLEGLLELGDYTDGDYLSQLGVKPGISTQTLSVPVTPVVANETKPSVEKPIKKRGLQNRLANFILPLLRRNLHH